MYPSYRVERAARGWYIFAVGEGGVPLYKLTQGPFKTEGEAKAKLRGMLFPSLAAASGQEKKD